MADESTLRQRKPQPKNDSESEVSQPSTPTKKGKKTSSTKADQDATWDGYSPYLDILRVISFLFVASMGLSYVISGGESYWWGHKNKPEWMTQKFYKELILGPPPPTYMTLEELSLYDGRDPDRPILLAINGTIYDVSPGRRMYGPGGSYSYFAATDAARGFVTGCFAEDQTADLRGYEETFLPIDNPEIDSYWTPEELAELKVKELEEAKQKAHATLKHWVDFFANNKKYSKVGYVQRDPDWLEKEKPKKLCDQAQKSRKTRKVPKSKQ
ncbi:membrane steroid-binding protein 2 [Fusarium sporotrichioides]|jgi:predicted heme/steroid binding protein|uniref:Membrane steroid-binding protein 2 n=1 Tax=Fusarium sporotrichioides TaxID=5514 RepID=A0A395RR71_FUSSP|nr:membrane steroid-binding protein 2 [Fusarium sporotrichioides]